MKQFYSLLFIISWMNSHAQNANHEIILSSGATAVSTTLPFDKPILLKWITKTPITIEYAGLIEIEKGNVTDYYSNFATRNSFMEYEYTGKSQSLSDSTGVVTVIDTRLTTNLKILADGTYQASIAVPPLEPNRFYDIKILRRPLDSELDLYFDLFLDMDNEVSFSRKLSVINEIKKPFKHTGDATRNRREVLQDYYDIHLKSLYIAYKAADKDGKPAIRQEIKSKIIMAWPAGMLRQAEEYLGLFAAIKSGDSAAQASAIARLAAEQEGFVLMVHDSNHVGTLGRTDLQSFYNQTPRIQNMVDGWVSSDEGRKKKALSDLIIYLVSEENTLPVAHAPFIFGETLSTTTRSFNFDTRTKYVITPDFGYVFYGFEPGFNNLMPYIGAQIEFRYFDKNTSFDLIRPKTLWHYLSFTTGVTLASMKKEGKRDDFFSSKSLLLGLGVRLTSATRITLGGILFRKEDPNPLIDNKTTAVAPFIGLSIDLSLKSLLNDYYGLNPTKKP